MEIFLRATADTSSSNVSEAGDPGEWITALALSEQAPGNSSTSNRHSDDFQQTSNGTEDNVAFSIFVAIVCGENQISCTQNAALVVNHGIDFQER